MAQFVDLAIGNDGSFQFKSYVALVYQRVFFPIVCMFYPQITRDFPYIIYTASRYRPGCPRLNRRVLNSRGFRWTMPPLRTPPWCPRSGVPSDIQLAEPRYAKMVATFGTSQLESLELACDQLGKQN